MAFDPNDENDKKLLEDAIAEATAGLKSKNSELIGDTKKLKEKLKEIESTFAGIDPVAVKAMMDRLANDEEAKLIADGKIDEVVNKRVERMREDYNKKLEEADKKVKATAEFASRFKNQVLSAAIRDAAIKAGVIPEAVDDVVYRARASGFTTDDEGNVIAVSGNDVVLSKDGKTPLQPLEWVESIRESASHLWPRASGGNAPGGGGKATKKFSEMNEAERVALYRKDPAEYERVKQAEAST